MANDIKQKIVLEGEKEYNRALTDAKRNLKTLKSELKAETAELGNNATAQQKNETRIKSLQKQIKEQEKVVKTYQDALKEVKEKYSDNEDAIAKWEVKLNEARATLATMKNDLDGVGNSFKGIENGAAMATVATKSVADTFASLSEIGSSISDSIENAFSGLLTTAREAVTQIWNDIVDLAARSNNLQDLAGFWNTDVMTIQKYAGAVSTVSGSLEDLNSLVTKINAGDTKKIAELTGVSNANYKDQWQYAMAVMDAMSKMSTENRNKVAFDIFGGRQATKAFDLLNDWNKLLDNLDKFDAEKGGYGLSEEELSSMSELYDKVNALKQSWKSLKDMAEVKLFGNLAINLTGNAQNIVDALLDYMNATSDEERDAAVQKIEDNIVAMFEAAKRAIEKGIELLDQVAEDLKKSDNPTAQALGNIVSGLVDALQWLTEDNMNNVVKALEILAAFWITGKGAAMGLKILEMVKNINIIRGYNPGGGNPGTSSSGAESIAGGATGALGAFGTKLTTASIKLANSGAGNLLGAAVMGAQWIGDFTSFGRTLRDGGTLGDALDNAAKTVEETFSKENLQKAADNWDPNNPNANVLAKLFGKRDENQDAASRLESGADWRGSAYGGMQTPAQANNPLDMRPSYMQGIAPAIEKAAQEIVEDVSLDRIFTDDERNSAIQDWWDAWREGAEDEGSAFDWMQEVLGDDFGEVWDNIIRQLDEIGDKQTELQDLPAEWWSTTTNGGNNGLTSEDISGFRGLPSQMSAAVRTGVSGIRVTLDGRTVGNLVAPYVSEAIARDIV